MRPKHLMLSRTTPARMVLAGTAVLLAACGGSTAPDPKAMAALEARPLGERMVSKIEDIKLETPQSLRIQDAALLLGRAASETSRTSNGFFGIGASATTSNSGALIMLNTADGRPKTSTMLFGVDAKDPSAQGWATTIVSPGHYFLSSMGAGPGHPMLMRQNLTGEIAKLSGQTVELKAGDVVYIGSLTTVQRDKEVSLKVRDESAEARAFLQTKLPTFAPAMTTRLLDCGCDPHKGTGMLMKNLRAAQDAAKATSATGIAATKP